MRDLLRVPPGVEARVLVECDGVLGPGLVVSDEVDGDVFPVVVMAVVHAEGITAPLVTVPEVPGQLEEVPTADHSVVDRSLGVEVGTEPIVGVSGLCWVAVLLG